MIAASTTQQSSRISYSCSGSQIQQLLEENNRLKKELQILIKQRDNFENTFRAKLEKIRSKSKSRKKINEDKENLGNQLKEGREAAQQTKTVQNRMLQNNNYLQSETSIKQNRCWGENQGGNKQNEQKMEEQTRNKGGVRMERTRAVGGKRVGRQNSELCQEWKRRAIYESQQSEKRIIRNYHRSTEPIQTPTNSQRCLKLRNTVYTQQ